VSDASKLAQLEKMAAKNPALAREANAAELTRLKSLEASKLTSAQLERIAFLERAQMSVPKRIGSSLGSTPGVMWTSSIAIGVLTMIPWFMSMAKKHDADPNAAADDPLGLAELLGPELAAIAPQLLVSLPFCLLCCCVFFVMMMMAMMAGSGSANS
jgi:hypothetical protein